MAEGTVPLTNAIIFPGQGAQAPGMGVAWLDHPAWEVVERAEAVLGERVGTLLLTASPEALERTREAQLAVFLASLVAWEGLRPSLEPPVAFAGHSLGELTALVAAGALTIEDGVRLVARRAGLTQAAAYQHPGRMAALLGATVEQAQEACAASGGDCWVANDNAPGQVVVAGTPAGVDATVEAAHSLGVRRAMPLNVGAAFHTPLMTEARAAFASALSATTFVATSAPVVHNGDAVAHVEPDGWRERLAEHLVRPVLWRQSLLTMAGLGTQRFLEVGPGGILAGMVRRTLPDTPVSRVTEPADLAVLAGAR